MKIIAELVRVRQDWDPDTNTHHNSVIFAFGGVQVEVEASPEQIKAIIIESQRQQKQPIYGGPTSGERHSPTEEAYEPEYDPYAGGPEMDEALEAELMAEDAVFGGDLTVKPPQLFQDPEPTPPLSPTKQRETLIAARMAQDPAQQRKEAKAAMRARAAQSPMRRVSADEQGNPVVYTDRSVPIAGSAGQPEVVVTRQHPQTGGDDDGFAQG